MNYKLLVIVSITFLVSSLPLPVTAYIVCKCPDMNRGMVPCDGNCDNFGIGCYPTSYGSGDHPDCISRSSGSVKQDCGKHWTNYKYPGESPGNPCPSGCTRADEPIEHELSAPRFRERFQCYGVPDQEVHCYDKWTSWVWPGQGVGNPCPMECRKRGNQLGEAYNLVGQYKVKFQCIKVIPKQQANSKVIYEPHKVINEKGKQHHEKYCKSCHTTVLSEIVNIYDLLAGPKQYLESMIDARIHGQYPITLRQERHRLSKFYKKYGEIGIRDLADYYASQNNSEPNLSTSNKNGKKLHDQYCSKCHTVNTQDVEAYYELIAGPEWYLRKEINNRLNGRPTLQFGNRMLIQEIGNFKKLYKRHGENGIKDLIEFYKQAN